MNIFIFPFNPYSRYSGNKETVGRLRELGSSHLQRNALVLLSFNWGMGEVLFIGYCIIFTLFLCDKHKIQAVPRKLFGSAELGYNTYFYLSHCSQSAASNHIQGKAGTWTTVAADPTLFSIISAESIPLDGSEGRIPITVLKIYNLETALS